MAYNKEKGKSHEDPWGLGGFYFIYVIGAPYYKEGHIGWVGEVQIIKKLLWTQPSRKSEHIRFPSRILEIKTKHVRPQPGHVRAPIIPQSSGLIRIRCWVPVRFTRHVRLLDQTCPVISFFTAAKSFARLIRVHCWVTVMFLGHIRSHDRTCLAPQL
jgi:hypothetical protein